MSYTEPNKDVVFTSSNSSPKAIITLKVPCDRFS